MKNGIVKYRYELFLSLLTLAMLAVMEWRHPYFFLQDDNRTYHLPYYVHNLKALLGGELPFFNFNQYLGTPVSFLSAPFYPLNYIAMLLSRLFLGHYFGAMEFIAVIHLTIAAVGFYRFSRSFGLDEFSCCFGAVAWAFSPFVITLGSSWIHTLGFAAYLPWILLFSLRQIDGFTWKDTLRLLLVRLLAILLGYPQWFLYTGFFELTLLVALYCSSKRNGRSAGGVVLFRYAGNYLVLTAVSLPVLLQLFHESSRSFIRNKPLSWEEYIMYSYRLREWLTGVFAPFNDSGIPLFGELDFVSHIGYLTLFCALIALIGIKKEKLRSEVIIFALLGLLSFLWSMDIGITKILYNLPFFNKLRYPFKLQFFTGFFLVTLSAFGFNLFSGWLRSKFRTGATPLLFGLIFLHTLNFAALYTLLPQRMLSKHLDTPPFVEPLAVKLTDGRIVSAGPDVVWDGERVVPANSVPTLGYNFAMLWGLHHFGGYEALLSQKNFIASMELVNNSIFNVETDKPLDFSADVPLEYLRKWGVKWYVVNSQTLLAKTEGLELVHSDRFRNVLYDPAGKPFVYWADGQGGAVPGSRFRTNSVEIATQRVGEGLLMVNVLYHPFFRGYLDGKEIPVTETEAGQMSIVVPTGQHKIQLMYIDSSFRKGLVVSGVIILAIALCLNLYRSAAGKRSMSE